MLIPLYDDNPVRRISYAYVNWALIAANVLIYAIVQSGFVMSVQTAENASVSYGMIPVILFETMRLPDEFIAIPSWATPVTSSFLHGSWMHLAGNMLFLWVFGDNVEDDLGHVRYLLFYAACAALAALAHAWAMPESTSPLIGASGAVSGMMAAAARFVFSPAPGRLGPDPWPGQPLAQPRLSLLGVVKNSRAALFLGIWFATNLLFGAIAAPLGMTAGSIAWEAHIGGFLVGLLVFPLVDRVETVRSRAT